MNKKRIFGIVLFMLLGFFVFTFANPKNDNANMKNDDIIKPTQDETIKPEENNNQEQQEVVQPVDNGTQQNTVQPVNNQAQNNNGGENNQVVPAPEPIPADDEPVEDLTDYRDAAKKEIVDYRDSLDLTTATDEIIENTNKKIDEATTKEAIDKVVDETKKLLDEVKASELAKAKEAAIKELNNYKKDYDYSKESQEKRKDIIDEYTDKINDAETIQEVVKTLGEGKAEIDKLIEEDLNNYRDAAKKEIVDYRDSLDLITSTDEIIENANKKIDEATTKEAIDKVVSDTKKLLDEIKASELAKAKEDAIKELNDYKKDYDYSKESQEKRKDIIDEYTDKINDAETIQEVAKLLEEGKAEIDKLIEEDLNEYKKQAKEELINYNKDELYSEENLKIVNEIKNDGIDEIDEATTKKEIDNIVTTKEEEIDKIQKLTETYFNVTFVNFYGAKKVVSVLYAHDAVAPEFGNVTDTEKGLVYKFNGWDKEFTNVKSDIEVNSIYTLDEISARINLTDDARTSLGSIKLTVTDELYKVIKANATKNISETESVIKAMIAEGETLPVSQKQNYKYTFNVLKYVADAGFYIEASEVIDEEQLAKNTVVLTYVVNGDAAFADGTTTKTVTTYTGSNKVELPAVYRNDKVVKVNWVDSNNELKDVYTKSETLTATLDKTAPVITLTGKVSRELIQSKDAQNYVEEGYAVSDATNPELTKDDVVVTITKDGDKVDAVSLNVPGKYVITYTVEDAEGNVGTATRTIVVTAIKLDNIQLVTTGNGEYFVGDAFDYDSITVTAYYNNDEKVTLGKDDYEISGFDTTKPTTEPQTATISYKGQTADYTYTVKAIKAEKLELSKTSGAYFVGDSMENVTVTVYFNNNTQRTLEASEYSKTAFDSTTATEENSNRTVTYSFDGQTANYTYTVKAIKAEKLELSKTSGAYFVGDSMENITVKAYFNNNTQRTLEASEYSKTAFDSTTATEGENRTVTYSFDGQTANYTYTVKAIKTEKLELSKTSGAYFVGDSMENVTVTAYFNNNTQRTLEASEYSKTDFDSTTATEGKNRTVTYTYDEKTADYTYTVTAIKIEKIELESTSNVYYVGDTVDKVKEKVTAVVYYNNRMNDPIRTTEYTVSGFNASKWNIGTNRKAYITYDGTTVEYKYEVKAVELDHISLSKTEGTYFTGDDMEDITVTAHYNNGTTKVLCDYYNDYYCYDGYVSDRFLKNSVGTHTKEYRYNGKKATYTYTIRAIELDHISLSKTEGTYFTGDDMEDITVTAHYNNGTSKELCDYYNDYYCYDGYTRTNFSTANAGNYDVTYTYNKKTATYNYTVNKLIAESITLSLTHGTYIVDDAMDNITVTVKYNNGAIVDVTSKAKIEGFKTSIDNVGNGKVAKISYDGLSANYTYDVKYHAEIGTKNVKVGHGHNAHYQDVYYLTFELPNNASVSKVVRTDANGASTVVNVEKDGNTYYISETDYNEIKKMKGNNPKQTLVVTYKVSGKEISSTYTRVVEK